MGNVQCCASGCFHEGKPQKKSKEKKKKTKGLKGVTKKTFSVGNGKGNGVVPKVVVSAEEVPEKTVPAKEEEKITQAAPPSENASETKQESRDQQTNSAVFETDAAAGHHESIAVARERFFKQVSLSLKLFCAIYIEAVSNYSNERPLQVVRRVTV